MEKYIIKGGLRLSGRIEAQSAKNSILALLAGSMLTTEQVIIHKCPKIADVTNMLKILEKLGVKVGWQGDSVILNGENANCQNVPKDLASVIRSSVFLLGSILSRFKKASISHPGGCDIGLRPIDLHIKGLKDLNVKVNDSCGVLECDGADMRGASVHLDYPSVGATENVMMAGVLIKGKTVITNAAKEPEIVDLQNFINLMGGKISGAGTSVIEIEGVSRLHGCEWTPIPDRIEIGTFMIATAVTGGEIEICNCNTQHIQSLITKLRESACKIWSNNDKIYLIAPARLNSVQLVETYPYPGFPTDLQAPITSMLSVANGTSIVIENMFETRFKHIAELVRLGADITIRDRMAIIHGVGSLNGAEVNASDLRGGAALVIAGLAANGKTVVNDIFHIERGYENFCDKLNSLGGQVTKV